VKNVETILHSSATIKVSDAHYVVSLIGILKVKHDNEYYSMSKEIRDFLVRLIEDMMFQGKYAAVVVEVFKALNTSYDVIPEDKPVVKTEVQKSKANDNG
jgi:hypothetical protein